jgi:GxxExxY protein
VVGRSAPHSIFSQAVESGFDAYIYYKDYLVPRKYRVDLLVEGKVIVDNKATSGLSPVDEAQLLNYLHATKIRAGLLINYGMPSLEYRRRIV